MQKWLYSFGWTKASVPNFAFSETRIVALGPDFAIRQDLIIRAKIDYVREKGRFRAVFGVIFAHFWAFLGVKNRFFGGKRVIFGHILD